MNNVSRYLIVSCTKENIDNFYDNTPLGKSLTKLKLIYPTLNTLIYTENKSGLSECYNKAINIMLNDDVKIIFIHDDVYINDMFIFEKLEEVFKEFDIIGVAGSSNFSLNRLPLAWHNSLRDDWSGGLFHPKVDKSENYNNIYYTDFGSFNKSVACIDGLFIAVKVSSIKEKEVRFDNKFTFDHYDLDFSLSCITKGLKIGTVPVILTHISHGSGINSERYKKLQDEVIKKWKSK